MATQSFYGLKEPSNDTVNPYYSGTVDPDKILDVTNVKVYVGDSAEDSPVTGLENLEEPITNFFELEAAMESSTYDGWRVDFDADSGERNITDSLLVSGYIIFNTYSPESGICDSGGTSNVYVRYYKTGTAYWEGSVGVDETDENTDGLYRAIDVFHVSGFLPKLVYVTSDTSQSEDGSTTGTLLGLSSASDLLSEEITLPLASSSGKISWEQMDE
ncbi:hypothetical protein JWG39_15295 [Desulforhopalus vacuolatus]|uniref:hypothetical protein n=1 Tax=Desulforhopalus vacuolatus TaxID=40414 RepID=UPI001963CE8E|nr:hypothetical protein [Desulforhopalus vacuolatus]MBM9521185.1 hypothetical protein [Desulforhopalus vacuolatus]